MRALTYFVAVSLDGFIAGPEHQIDGFNVGPELIGHIIEHYPESLPTPARGGLQLTGTPNQQFDTVLMGRHTYELGLKQGLTNPYEHLEQIVFSSRPDLDLDQAVDQAVTVTAGNPIEVVQKLKANDGGLGIWLCGGGLLAGALVNQIDRLILKRYPVIFGAGRPLFEGQYVPLRFKPGEREQIDDVSIETYHPA